MNITSKKLVEIYIISVLLNTAFFSLLYIFFPELSDNIFAEDNLVENLSAFFYLLSFVAGIYSLTRLKDKGHMKFYAIIPLISIIFFLEEIEYGERFLNWESSKVYHIRFNSLHDLIPIAHEFLQIHSKFLLYAIFFTFCIILIVLSFKYRDLLYRFADKIKKYPSIGLLLTAAGFLSSVQVFDFNFIKSSFEKVVEELFELNGAITIFFTSVIACHTANISEQSKIDESNMLKRMPQFVAVFLGLLCIMVIAIYFVLSAHTIKYEKESRRYIQEVIPLILSSWDPVAFIRNSPPELPLDTSSSIHNYFSIQSEHFSSLKEYRLLETQLVGRTDLHIHMGVTKETIILKNAIIFDHAIFAVFEKAQAIIHVETVKLEQVGWRIASMKIEPIP